MQVLVLGAGLAGVTTAWLLAREGAQVTVLDRRPGPAQETSHANGGHLSGSGSRPWTSPAVPRQLSRWLGRADAPLRVPLRWDPSLWRWGVRAARNCTAARYRANTLTLQRLARLSRDVLEEERAGIEFGYRPGGVLAVYRTPESAAAAEAEAAWLAREGFAGEAPMSAEDCVRLEPALADAAESGRFASGVLARDAATGDAHAFTVSVAERCQAQGVSFRFDVEIRSLRKSGRRVRGAETSDGFFSADATVLSLACDSPAVARTAGLEVPVVPVKGTSVTVAATGALPTLGVFDAERKVVTARLGAEFRAAGLAEFAGADYGIDLARVRVLLDALTELYPEAPLPGAGDARPWTGLRPMTPDGPPILGPAPARSGCTGLFCNTGHGAMGWTLACGSAAMTTDWIAGRVPRIDPAGLTLDRFG